jgi:hypothetical protein
MTERPFRHLCPEADLRDGMTDEEFWAHVYDFAVVPVDDIGHPDYDTPVSLSATPCATCGEVGACAYDGEGRALIHATEDSDDDD